MIGNMRGITILGIFLAIVVLVLPVSAGVTTALYPANDSYLQRSLTLNSTEQNWSTITIGNGVTSSYSANLYVFYRNGVYPNNTNWTGVNRPFFTFNLSSIPAGSVITSASLSLWGRSKTNPFGGSPNITITNATPASSPALVTADFQTATNKIMTNNMSYADYSGTNTTYNNWTMNSNGLQYLQNNIGGYSTFVMRSDWDVNRVFGGSTFPNYSQFSMATYGWQYPGTDRDPVLTIEYTPPPNFVQYAEYDGKMFRSATEESLSTILNGAGTSVSRNLTVEQISGSTGFNDSYRSGITFNTTTIPAGATITSATISLYGTAKSSVSTQIVLVDFTPTNKLSFASSDYNIAKWGSTPLSQNLTYANITTTGYNNFTLYSPDTKIVKGGYTTLGFRTNKDIDSDIGSFVAGNYYGDSFAGSLYAGTSQDPIISINYTINGNITTYPVRYINETKILPTSNTNLPPIGTNISINATPGEWEPASFVIKPNITITNVDVIVSALSYGGNTIPANATDVRTVKAWYVSGSTVDQNLWVGANFQYALTPELLLKNDSLIRVDYANQTNEIWISNSTFAGYYHIDNRTVNAFPNDARIFDNATGSGGIQPFSLPANENKQFWLTTHVPNGQTAGTYTGTITINSSEITPVVLNYSVTVLPFSLVNSTKTYGLYYYGRVNQSIGANPYKVGSYPWYKSVEQYTADIVDMRDHGITYPVLSGYRQEAPMETAISIRSAAGLPKDKIFINEEALIPYDPDIRTTTDPSQLANLKTYTQWMQNITGTYGFGDNYAYGYDEPNATTVTNQATALDVVRGNGSKTWQSSQREISIPNAMRLDAITLAGNSLGLYDNTYHNTTLLNNWRSANPNIKLYVYDNPQVGLEDPEVYRMGYGFALWNSSYNGTINFIYQDSIGSQTVWNDYDGSTMDYRDHVFSYPTSTGGIPTIQWEGMREAVDDAKYSDTLTAFNGNSTQALSTINSGLAAGKDMSVIRGTMIDNILASGMDIKTPPVANFTCTPTSGAVPLNVTCTDTSTNTPTGWIWSWKNATTSWAVFNTSSGTPQPLTLYTGIYDFNLSVSNEDGSNTKVRTGYVTVSGGYCTGGLCTIPAAKSDNVGEYTDESWAAMRNDAGDGVTSSNSTIYSGQTLAAGSAEVYNYHVRGLVSFNTSILPAGSTILNASLVLSGSGKNNEVGTVDASVIYTNPASYTSFTGTDYNNTNFTRVAPDIPYASFAYPNATNTFTLNTLGINSINKTGYTAYMLTHSADVDNTTLSWSSGKYSTFWYRGYLYDSGSRAPYLSISYTTDALPDADFSASVTRGVSPLSVTLTDTSTNSPTNWAWYFGNGTQFSSSQNPAITLSPGAYDIRLYASNAVGGSWENKSAYIIVSSSSAKIVVYSANAQDAVFFNSSTTACSNKFRMTTDNISSDGTYRSPRVIADTSANNCTSARRSGFTFNTASLPDSANITYVVASFGSNLKENQLGSPSLGITGFSPASFTSLVKADGDTYGSVRYASDIPYASIPADGRFNFTMNTNGLSAINKTGYTALMVRLADWDIDNNMANFSWVSGQNSAYNVKEMDYGGTTYDPFLEIYYYDSSAASPTTSFTKTVTSRDHPVTVALNDTSGGTPTSWLWSFKNTTPGGNGTPIEFTGSRNTSLTLEAGNWEITLEATNDGGSTETTQQFNVTYNMASRRNTTGISLYPSDFVWNTRIDTLPVEQNSSDWVRVQEEPIVLKPHFGSSEYSGMPVDIVDSNVPMIPAAMRTGTCTGTCVGAYWPYIYPNPNIENAVIPEGSTGDAHYIIYNKDTKWLYEAYAVRGLYPNGSLNISAGSIWNTSNYSIVSDAKSANVAGTSMLPGLIRYDEVANGSINHAFTTSIPWARTGADAGKVIWPAVSGGGNGEAATNNTADYPPMGARFRLNASYDISGFSPQSKVILQAMKNYGMIVTDNDFPGTQRFGFNGVRDSRWNWTDLLELQTVPYTAIEAVNESSLMISRYSGQVNTSAFGTSPVASFSSAFVNADAPLIYTFNDTSTNTPLSWAWYFTNTSGNNTEILFSNSKNATLTLEAGNWQIKLRATNGAGSSNATTFKNVTYSWATRHNLTGVQLFPSDFIWNVRIDTLPIHPNSSEYIAVQGDPHLRANFGYSALNGYTYDVVDSSSPKPQAVFRSYAAHPDNGTYPYPSPNPNVEGGISPDVCSSSYDCHVSMVDKSTRTLYELYSVKSLWPNGTINASSGRIWNMSDYSLGNHGQTTPNVAGTPILPALLTYEEVQSGHVHHALMLDLPWARVNSHVWPAIGGGGRGTNTSTAYPSMGQRFRLNATYDISSFSPTNQVILTGMKEYGMILADNAPSGWGFLFQGVRDSRWDNSDLNMLATIPSSAFEAIDESSLMISDLSGQAYVSLPTSHFYMNVSGSTPAASTYGAESYNSTSNPIGGGTGYTSIVTGGDYEVSTKAALITALGEATTGKTVYITPGSTINLSGENAITINSGVTLASNRGSGGSQGALIIKKTGGGSWGWEQPVFKTTGSNVRVTGLRFEGENQGQDWAGDATGEAHFLVGVEAEGATNFVVDNCEMYGWAWSAISLDHSTGSYIHNNYIHNNEALGEGYGSNLYSGDAIFERNIYDYNRHSITGAGLAGEQYTARYNIVKGNGAAIGGAHFDVHRDEDGGTFAGQYFSIDHNTFQNGVGWMYDPAYPPGYWAKLSSVHIRAAPTVGMNITNNLFQAISTETTDGYPIYQTDALGTITSLTRLNATDNQWMTTVYPNNTGIARFGV
jgi:PKD repeat protein